MINAQNGVTFKIEELKKPDGLLWLKSKNDIFRQLILSDVNISEYEIEENKIDFQYNIISSGTLPDSLVNFGYHSFFNGMYQAYADHRPFVLSPDMIWLLISQGFARHVNANAEELRKYFVDFNGKISLIVMNDSILLDNPKSPWENVFPEFTKQISAYTGQELINTLSCDFSTTSLTSKIASEVTVMEEIKPYFDFIVIYSVCGIPEITLEGTSSDWQKVLDKAKYLRKYQLGWWIDEIEPLLEEFINASKGNIDRKFWRNMFKYHSQKEYGAPEIIDGWIVKLFPYDKEGKRNNLKEIVNKKNNLPNEIVKVDFQYIKVDGNKTENTPLELWAGFVGLEQNHNSYSLKPQIGWMIRKKDIGNKALVEKFKTDNSSNFNGIWGGIMIRVKIFPKELLKLDQIKYLEIEFLDDIIIPDEISNIKIDKFKMTGKISKLEIERIRKLLPNTELIINGNK